MAWPVLPPMPETALLAADAAPLTALPAELVTLERPCCALPAASDAPSLAFVAVEEAVSAALEVVDSARRWSAHRVCRSATRGASLADMVGWGG
jgi:hypothetical protein